MHKSKLYKPAARRANVKDLQTEKDKKIDDYLRRCDEFKADLEAHGFRLQAFESDLAEFGSQLLAFGVGLKALCAEFGVTDSQPIAPEVAQ
jgi:hypothetical protein